MTIKDFSSIRVGSGWPQCVDVRPHSGHESYGVMAVAYTFRDEHARKIQLRKANCENAAVALFSFRDAEQANQLPVGWEASELLWEMDIPASS